VAEEIACNANPARLNDRNGCCGAVPKRCGFTGCPKASRVRSGVTRAIALGVSGRGWESSGAQCRYTSRTTISCACTEPCVLPRRWKREWAIGYGRSMNWSNARRH